jgi:hypothetical protein
MGSAMGTRDYLKIRSIIPFARQGGSFPPQFFSSPASEREAKVAKDSRNYSWSLIRDRVWDAHGGLGF